MLTYDEFLIIPNGTNFAQGEIVDSPEGLYMTGSRRILKWVAVKEYANDWCVYTHWMYNSVKYVVDYGDKVLFQENIENIIKFDDEVWKRYGL